MNVHKKQRVKQIRDSGNLKLIWFHNETSFDNAITFLKSNEKFEFNYLKKWLSTFTFKVVSKSEIHVVLCAITLRIKQYRFHKHISKMTNNLGIAENIFLWWSNSFFDVRHLKLSTDKTTTAATLWEVLIPCCCCCFSRCCCCCCSILLKFLCFWKSRCLFVVIVVRTKIRSLRQRWNKFHSYRRR